MHLLEFQDLQGAHTMNIRPSADKTSARLRLALGSLALSLGLSGLACAAPTEASDTALLAAGPGAAASSPATARHGRDESASFRLSDTQRQQMRALMQESREANRANREALRDLRQSQARLLGAAQLDTQALQANQAQIQVLQSQMAASRLQTHIKISQMLTPEQRAQMAQRWARRVDFRAHHGHHHHHRWQHGGHRDWQHHDGGPGAAWQGGQPPAAPGPQR